MGLFTTAAAFGVGYTLGRPDGRARAKTYLGQARQWAKRPEVTRLRERGWDVAGEQLAAIRRRFGARHGSIAAPAPPDPAARDARQQLARGWRRRRSVAPTLTGAPAEVGPNVVTAPTDPTPGLGDAAVAEESRAAVLGHGTLPPAQHSGSPGPTSTGS